MDKNQQELIYIHPFINDCKRSVPKSRTLKKPTDPDSCGPPLKKSKSPNRGIWAQRRAPQGPVGAQISLFADFDFFKGGPQNRAKKPILGFHKVSIGRVGFWVFLSILKPRKRPFNMKKSPKTHLPLIIAPKNLNFNFSRLFIQ